MTPLVVFVFVAALFARLHDLHQQQYVTWFLYLGNVIILLWSYYHYNGYGELPLNFGADDGDYLRRAMRTVLHTTRSIDDMFFIHRTPSYLILYSCTRFRGKITQHSIRYIPIIILFYTDTFPTKKEFNRRTDTSTCRYIPATAEKSKFSPRCQISIA